MNHLRHATFCATVTAALVLVVFVGNAGEPIIIPGEKQKTPPPALDKKFPSRDVFRFGDKLSAPSGFDVLTVPVMPLDPREQRRRKLERLERENWIVVGKGELQAEEEEKNFWNVRDDSLEGFEKEDSRGDLMFRNLGKDGNQRLPGQFRSSKEPVRQPGKEPLRQFGKEPLRQPGLRLDGEDEEEESKDTPRLQREEPKEGAHVASELNLKKMFEPRKERENDSLTPRFNKSDLILQHLLSGGISPEARREQQVRSQEFRSFLDNRGGAAPLAGPSDPINFGSDFTRQPINPTTPQPIGGGVAGSANRFGSPSAAPRPGSPLAGGLPTAFAGVPAPAGFSAGPLLAPKTEPVRPAKQMTFDPPRRKF
jgi:hypothetical protein